MYVCRYDGMYNHIFLRNPSGSDSHAADKVNLATAPAQPPGLIQKVDPSLGSVIYTIGVPKSRAGGSTFWILPGICVVQNPYH